MKTIYLQNGLPNISKVHISQLFTLKEKYPQLKHTIDTEINKRQKKDLRKYVAKLKSIDTESDFGGHFRDIWDSIIYVLQNTYRLSESQARILLKESYISKNPYKSKAQERLFHALAAKGRISPDIVAEYDKESTGLDLPERVSNPTTRKALEDNIKKRVYNFGYRENFDNTPPFTEKRAEMLISDIILAGFKPTLTISELMRIYKTGLEDYHDLYD